MRRFYSSALAGAIFLVGGASVKADINYFLSNDSSSPELFKFNSSTNTFEKLSEFDKSANNNVNFDNTSYWHDNSINNIYFQEKASNGNYTGRHWIYDIDANTWEATTLSSETSVSEVFYFPISTSTSAAKTKSGSTTTTKIGSSTKTVLEIGGDTNPTTINQEGISVAGSNLIKREANGITSIGANSFKMQETATEMKLWATNSSGEIAPINITNGTKLLINGRDVDQAIDNVGALSAALTGLPTVPQDSPLACGVGAGAHSGSNALSGGCASKVNERLTFNVAASFIPANQKYQGTDNAWSGRAGFVFKLGKINKPTLISMKEKKTLQAKVEKLSNDNQAITQSNQELKDLIALQNQNHQDEMTIQKARLEKLEKIALANQSDQKTATSFFNISNLFSTMRSFLISSN